MLLYSNLKYFADLTSFMINLCYFHPATILNDNRHNEKENIIIRNNDSRQVQ